MGLRSVLRFVNPVDADIGQIPGRRHISEASQNVELNGIDILWCEADKFYAPARGSLNVTICYAPGWWIAVFLGPSPLTLLFLVA
jgi:hypothetical protein